MQDFATTRGVLSWTRDRLLQPLGLSGSVLEWVREEWVVLQTKPTVGQLRCTSWLVIHLLQLGPLQSRSISTYSNKVAMPVTHLFNVRTHFGKRHPLPRRRATLVWDCTQLLCHLTSKLWQTLTGHQQTEIVCVEHFFRPKEKFLGISTTFRHGRIWEDPRCVTLRWLRLEGWNETKVSNFPCFRLPMQGGVNRSIRKAVDKFLQIFRWS